MFSTNVAQRNISKNVSAALNIPKNSTSIFSNSLNSKTNTSLSFFGSYVTLILTLILFAMVFAGIYIYFQNIGYTIDMGWNKLMTVFGLKEDVTVSLSEDKKQVGSVRLEAPKTEPSPDLTAALGLGPAIDSLQRDLGNPPPPPEGSLPFSREERPSGMPGATEDAYRPKEKRNKKKKKRSSSTSGEVFNVSRNLYTYDEAAPLCKAMGAELATYEQIVDAQKSGADWCNYGWTKGQMAVFPTSDRTYEKLQSGPPEYRSSCGKPGVNGGFFDNPELRFGVNCFGKRPVKKDTDELLNDTDTIVPPSAEQIEFDKRVQVFREQIDNISVLPWNKRSWSE